MPRYDFDCQACHATFEVQASFSEYAALMKEQKITCPKCGSQKVARVFSPPAVLSAVKQGGGGCGCAGGRCG